MSLSLINYVEFTINFLVIFGIFINLLLLIATSFKTRKYSIEIVVLGMISFFVLLVIHEFTQLTVISYRMAEVQGPLEDSIISEMFGLMASMLIFSVGVTKNRLKNFKLGSKK